LDTGGKDIEKRGHVVDKKEEKEFESLIDIDKTRLDDESEDQPEKVWAYGKLYAKAVKLLSEAKAELKVVEADVDAAVREDPSDFGLEKLNETAIKRAILRSKEFQIAQEKQNEAEYRVNMLEAANRTLDHRRTSLTMLNSQDERNYFSRPQQKGYKDTGKSTHRKPLRKRHDS
jgi:hypothetical protein